MRWEWWFALACVIVGTTCMAAATLIAHVGPKLRARDACRRFHPGEPCRPGSNHPGVNHG